MMKKPTIFIAAIAFIALTGCQKEPVSTTDRLPLPAEVESSKDNTIKPGDSFYDYCNGTWLKNTPVPESATVGGLYDQDIQMQNFIDALKAEVPDIGRFFQLMEAASGNPEASKAYLDKQKARYPKPQTREEALLTLGKMMADGFVLWPNAFFQTFTLIWKDGRLMGKIMPYTDIPMEKPEELDPSTLVPVSATKADGEASSEALIIKGMGLDISLFVTAPDNYFWKVIDGYSLEQLCDLIDKVWAYYEKFGAAELAADIRMDARYSLNYTLSYHFAQKFMPEGFREKYLNITKEIQASLRNRIQQVDWMSETTKGNALDKLDAISLNVAAPEEWHTDCVASLADCETLIEAVQRNQRGIVNLRAHLLGGKDIFSYFITTNLIDSNSQIVPADFSLVNAMYSPNYNCVLIYPSILLPPMMPENVSEAYQYAAFVLIGHEFTHGFDNTGSQYDKLGNLKNWWTVADKMAFEDRSDNLVACYNHLEMDPLRASGIYGDGTRTLGENIADLGGFLTVLDAYKAKLVREGYSGDVMNDQLRKFYESYAHTWCVQYNEAKLEVLKKSDVHSHARLRVNGVVMNTDLWYQLYGVDRNNVLYLPKERRTYIW